MPRSTLWIGVRVPRQITSQPFKEITQYDLACSGADDSRNFKGARTDCLKPECSVCQVNSEGEFEFSDSTFMWGGKHSRHSGLSSPETPRPRSGGESPTAGTTRRRLRGSSPGTSQIQRKRKLGIVLLRRHDHHARGVAGVLKPGQTTALCLLCVDRELLIRPSAGMRDMIRAAADGAPGPSVHDIEHQGRVYRDIWVQAGRRLPGAITHPSHKFAAFSRGMERHAAAVAHHHEALARHSAHFHLEPLHRRVHVADGRVPGDLFTEHVPRLQGVPQLQPHTLPGYRTDLRKAKLEVWGKPLYLELEPRLTKVRHHALPVDLNKVRQHEAVVQRGPPPYEFPAVWRFPETCRERPHQQLLREAHLRVRRHLKSAQLYQSEARSGGVWRVEFVDAELGAVRVTCQIGEKMTKLAIGQPQRTSR